MVNSQQPIFLFATEGEAAQIRAARSDLDIRICGVGVVECALSVAEIICREHPKQIVLCGIAGAYSRQLKVGDVVSVVVENTVSLPAVYRKSYSATIKLPLQEVVSNTVMAVGAEASGAQVENMEGAAIFALCNRFGVECGQIRAISNYVDDVREQWDIPTALDALTKVINDIY